MELNYEIIKNDKNLNDNDNNINNISNIKTDYNITNKMVDNSDKIIPDNNCCSQKEINMKLKELQHNLHNNNISEKLPLFLVHL